MGGSRGPSGIGSVRACVRHECASGAVLDRRSDPVGRFGAMRTDAHVRRSVKTNPRRRTNLVIVVIAILSLFAVSALSSSWSPNANSAKPSELRGSSWTAEGDQIGANFGYSVSEAGDVNNDGYDDVIVGAHNYDNGETDEGRALLYLGSAAGISAAPSWIAENDQAYARFGNSVSSAGDVNGDGYDDVVVGSYVYDAGETDEGRAYVYLGSSSGLSASPSWIAEGNQGSAYFGSTVSSAGDVNGDGYDDVVVAALFYTNGESLEGRVYLFPGSSSGLSASPSWTAEGNQAFAYFGRSVSSAGDVNGDGYSDVIIGAYYYDNGQTNEGRAFLYLGSSTGLPASASWTGEIDQVDAWFGSYVSTAGDVNADGYDDVVVGAVGYDNGQINEGSAYLFLGSTSGLSASPSWSAESDQEYAYSGVVSSAGDVNSDGYDDVVVGSYMYSNGEEDEGRVFLYLGSPSGLVATASWTAESDQAFAMFGSSLSSAGDVDNDGYDEVIVGAYTYDNGQNEEGRAFMFYGYMDIPEFSMVVLPAMGVALTVFVVSRRRRRLPR